MGCEEEEVRRFQLLHNHAKHVALGMECTSCHTGAREGVYAGIPSIRKCALCHTADRSDPPTPTQLAKYIEKEEEIPWDRINRLPGHVYFSHAAHVKYAEMDCGECHGAMDDPVNPVERPLVRFPDMQVCIDCHSQKQVSSDCLMCHK